MLIPQSGQAQDRPPEPQTSPTTQVTTKVVSIPQYIEQEALKRNLEPQKILDIVRCESGFVPQQSRVIQKDGSRENSWGVWQIHLDSWPDITQEQAMSVVWSTDWSLAQLEKGNWHLWSCAKKLKMVK